METNFDQNNAHESNVILFRKNWNNNLGCDFFTTIKLKSKRYEQGKIFRIQLAEHGVNRSMFEARITSLKPMRLHQFTEDLCLIAFGQGLLKTREMMYFQYKDHIANLETAEFYWILFERIRTKPVQAELFGLPY